MNAELRRAVYVAWNEHPVVRVTAAVVPTRDIVTAAAAADAAWRVERRSYRDLCIQKHEAFWRMKVDSVRSRLVNCGSQLMH